MKNLKKVLAFIMCLSIIASLFGVVPVANAYSGTTVSFDNLQVIPTEFGENLVAGEFPIYVEYKQGDKAYTEKELYPSNANLTNGQTGDSWHMTKALFAHDNADGTRTFYSDGSAYCKVIYSLEGTTDIDKICIINHPAANLVTGKYEVYASRYRHELFSSESLIATVDNTANYNYRQIITCSGVTGVNYFAIKVIIPCKNVADVITSNCYPRFSELCIYGTESDKREDIPQVANSSSKTNVTTVFEDDHLLDFTDSSKNFLYGKTTTNNGITLTDTYYHYYEKKVFGIVYSKGYEQVTETAIQKTGSETHLTDGDVKSDWYTSSLRFLTADDIYKVGFNDYRDKTDADSDADYDYYVDVFFDAGSSKQLGLFYISHHSTEALRTMHYRVYASNTAKNASSFTDADIIADCINYSGTQEHYITVAPGQTVNARYYLIRVYNPCFDYGAPVLQGSNLYNNAYLRLNEVAAFTADSMRGSLEFSEDSFKFYGSDYIGGIKKGATVKTIVNNFTGIGNISVLDKNDNAKMPSEKIQPGDRVVVDTGYGENRSANLTLQCDLNGSGTHTVSDIVIARNAVLDGATDNAVLAAGDADLSGAITVTDIVKTTVAVMEGVDFTDTTEPIKITQKNGKPTSGTRKIAIDTNEVLTEDFVGFGTNSFPSTLATDVQKKIGFNMVYNELNAKRLSSLALGTSRMWFQVDWVVTETCDHKDYAANPEANPDYKNYLNGVYDFDNQWMQAVYEYVGMLKEAGTNVEINFGWKTATRIQDWFGTPSDDPIVSAPKDLDAFAAAAASLMEELHRRGYDNAKAITFYNEPNLDGDFQSGMTNDGHDDRIYWSQLVAKVDAEFTKRGLDEKVQIWGPECSGVGIDGDSHRGWLEYQIKNSAAYVDVWTGHHYYASNDLVNNYSDAFDSFVILSKMANRNMIITEMQGHVSNPAYKNWFSWNDSTTGYFIAASNTGIRGTFTWITVGGYLPDPLDMQLYGDDTSAWAVPLTEERANTVNRVFYEESLLTNYVPRGSKVLYTQWTGDDIRTSAYRLPDGNITVVVENNGYFSGTVLYTIEGQEKDIEIKIGDGKTREFKRISYIAETQNIDANATINSPDKTITAQGGVITDTLGSDYSVHIYTTAPVVKQVQIKDAEVTRHIKAGGTTKIDAELIDCDSDDEIVYSISQHTGTASGTISKDGLYTAAADAKVGDMVAVRASLKSDPSVFAVAVIYID